MKVFLLALALVALCVLGLCFNILFRKKDFPHYDVGSNEEMKKRGYAVAATELGGQDFYAHCPRENAVLVIGSEGPTAIRQSPSK